MTKKPEDHLPRTAPKRTGKRGIKPVDEEDRKTASAEPKEVDPPKGKRQKDLPGMEDKHLADLEETATDYAEVRDKRMALTRRETDLKDVLLTLMKRHNKTVYRVEEMEIRVVAKDETVKVKILSDDED